MHIVQKRKPRLIQSHKQKAKQHVKEQIQIKGICLNILKICWFSKNWSFLIYLSIKYESIHLMLTNENNKFFIYFKIWCSLKN
jgi:hypothetical protein